jgi:hypothetical protein
LTTLNEKFGQVFIVREANSIMEWAGSDVIISSQLNDSIKEWFGDQFPVFTLEKTEQRRKESEVLQICKVLQSFL